MWYPSVRTVAIIAEGVPEQQTKAIIKTAEDKKIGLIGPATVGGIKPRLHPHW
jgi:ATP citrate (pro-S)-lyase